MRRTVGQSVTVHPVAVNAPVVQTASEWSIELMRGLAAMLVVLAHYHPLVTAEPGLLQFAFTGVDLFFVISGFVFAPYFFGKRLSARAYLVRRLFRIYPLYVVALLGYAWLRWAHGQDVAHLGKHLLFLHTLESREIAFQFNPAFWSLPPEVEYYLVLPWLAALAGTWRKALAITVVAAVVHLAIARLGPADAAATGATWLLGFHLPALLVEFMLGTLAWRAVGRGLSNGMRVLMLAVGLGAWFALALAFSTLGDAGVAGHAALRGNVGLLAAMAYALILAAWVGWVRHPVPWLLALATAAGNLSYGLYLFHNAMPVALARLKASLGGSAFALLCLAATALTAQVLHVLWESPCRDWGRRLAQRMDAGVARQVDR